MCTLCTGVYDEQDNDKGTISLFLSDTSANASGSILCLYEHMNARRCKISFLCKTLRVGENRKIERGRLQLNLPSLSIHGSVKYPVKSHQTLTITVQSAMTAQLKPRLQIFLSWLQFYSKMRVNHTYFRNVHQSWYHYYALRFGGCSSIWNKRA